MSLILDRIGLKTGPETIIDTIFLTRERGFMAAWRQVSAAGWCPNDLV